MNDAIGTGSIIDWLSKETSFSEFTFNSLLGGDFLLTQHRETLLVEIQQYSVKVFSAIHVRISRHGMTTLPVGGTHFVFSTRTVCLLKHFLFHHFIFFVEKQTKYSLQFLFNNVEVFPPLF
jgi:hypothetical protein